MKQIIITTFIIQALALTGCTGITPNQQPHSDITRPASSPKNTNSYETISATKSTNDKQKISKVTQPASAAVDKTPAHNPASAQNRTGNPKAKQPQVDLDSALELCRDAQELWQSGDLDHAITTLDEAYSKILDVNSDPRPDIIQQKEDLRFMISKRILEIYASRNIVVNGEHNAIPLTMNPFVQKELNRFTGRERSFFIQSYKRSAKYRPYICRELKKAGLPEELSWLPLIESGYKVKALSKARALGLWQFIPSTGYRFGLKRDLYVDERIDPEKATQAAIKYLTALHRTFGDWATVLAAYNCGEGRVLRVIRKQNINYLDNFWDLYNKLPRETARYVPRFLAVLHIINNPAKYGFDLEKLNTSPPTPYEITELNKQVYLKDIAKNTGISFKTLKELNPELRYALLPDRTYPLKVPAGSGKKLLASIDSIKASRAPSKSYIRHRVRSGESLYTIARKYKTSVSAIARANKINKTHYIVTGKILKIPGRGYTPSSGSTGRKTYVARNGKHTVRSGDSLWIIARRYNTRIDQIMSANKLKSPNLHIGQVLIIPGSGSSAKKAKRSKTGSKLYMVKQGDNPYIIAQKHNITLKQLLNMNNLTSRSKIYPGQKLVVF